MFAANVRLIVGIERDAGRGRDDTLQLLRIGNRRGEFLDEILVAHRRIRRLARAQNAAIAGHANRFLFGFEIEIHIRCRVGNDGNRARFRIKAGRGDGNIERVIFQWIGENLARGCIGRQNGIGARAGRVFERDGGIGHRFLRVHVLDDDVQSAHDIGASGQGKNKRSRSSRDERKHSIFGFHKIIEERGGFDAIAARKAKETRRAAREKVAHGGATKHNEGGEKRDASRDLDKRDGRAARADN